MNIQTVQILNVDTDESTATVTEVVCKQKMTKNLESQAYILSDVDEELLILVEFECIVNLKSITIHSSVEHVDIDHDISPPKQVNVYHVGNLNINFDDIRSMKPDKSIKCSIKRLCKGQNINLQKNSKNVVKFKKTQYLAIYIESNQNDTEKTLINMVTFKGSIDKTDHKQKIYTQQLLSTKPYIFDETTAENNSKLHEITQKYGDTMISPNPFNPSRYLEQYRPETANDWEQSSCNLTKCQSLQRINRILTRYHAYIDDEYDIKQEVDDNVESLVSEQDNDNGFNIYDKNYDNVQLLDDYHHLLFQHHDEQQFEDIHQILMKKSNNDKPCNLLSCYIMRRNHRDRDNVKRNSAKIRELYGNHDDADIIKQQHLDKIHCHYFHSFDIGLRVRNKEKMELMKSDNIDDKKHDNTDEIKNDDDAEMILKISKLIMTKKNAFRNVNGLKRLQNNKKFKTIINKDIDDEKRSQITTYYSFGHRYYYWDYYKNNHKKIDVNFGHIMFGAKVDANTGYKLSDWYINAKYNNLKDESLNNEICNIGELQWINIYQNASHLMQTQIVKTILCVSPWVTMYTERAEEIYNIKQKSPICCDHLIAILIYCNMDKLQQCFTETYRRIPDDETDKSLKARHSNYHHLGRLLRELVECFGTEDVAINGRFSNGHLFHGISVEVNFNSIYTQIYGPLSTTTDFSVAVNFCNNKGMVVELRLDRYWGFGYRELAQFEYETPEYHQNQKYAFFDCHWLSDYSNEMEIFFIGGYSSFAFETIIHAANGINYHHYNKGLIQLGALMNGVCGVMQCAKIKTEFEAQMVYRLLSHELHRHYPNNKEYHQFKSIPKYIDTLLHKQCQNTTSMYLYAIQIDVMVFATEIKKSKYKEKFCKKLFESVFFYDNGVFKWDVLMTVFPSIQVIQLEKPGLMLLDDFYLSLLEFLRRRITKLLLYKIYATVQDTSDHTKIAGQMINKYNKQFGEFGWFICYSHEGTVLYMFVQSISHHLENGGQIRSIPISDTLK